MPAPLLLGADPLTLAKLDPWLGRRVLVALAPAGLHRAAESRARVERIVASGAAVYGINTGFGYLKNKRIATRDLDRLQENLLISHAVGVGPPVPPEIVRWMLVIKTHMLLAGLSGVRPLLIERLAAWLNHDLLPLVPSRGSLGASGDLAPLAHLCLPLLDRGELCPGGDLAARRPAAAVQRDFGLEPLRLGAKEGLALINGTQFMCAYAAQIGVRARRLIDLADLIVCLSIEGLRGSLSPADARLHAARPHPGAQRVAANIRRHMAESEILASHAGCDKVQDPYSLRCAPQVHGAFRDALDHYVAVIERELNSVTDNPLLFEAPVAAPEAGPATRRGQTTPQKARGRAAAGRAASSRGGKSSRAAGGRAEKAGRRPIRAADAAGAEPVAISGGNFHGAPLALVLDYLAIALTDLASISERRTYLLLNGEDGLPKLLMRDTGLNSGFMLPQYTAAALVNECKVYATPASVDSIPSSLGQEDHVSMGATSALKCFEILDRAETVLAIELMCAAQAIDYRMPLRPGVGPRAAHLIVREHIPHAEVDREFGQDIRAAMRLIRESEPLRRVARGSSE